MGKVQKAISKVKILGVGVSVTDSRRVIDYVFSNLEKGRKIFVSTPNPEIVLQAQKSRKLLSALNSSDVALPDGIGLLWANFVLNGGRRRLKRVTGRGIFESILSGSEGKKIFLLGASEKVNRKAVEKMEKKYPGVEVNGEGGMKVGKLGEFENEKEEASLLKSINKFKPDFLFVAFGAPKQELWVNRNFENLDVGCVMVVGGSLDYFAGEASLPPGMMSKLGLEWLWRVVHEPGRLVRVFRAVVIFPLVVLREAIG